MEQGRGQNLAGRAPVAGVWAAGIALLLTLLIVGPFGTNDGPAHIGFARLFVDGPAGPLQDSIYRVSHAIRPNMLIYILAGPGIGLFGHDMTERLVQALVLLGLPLAGWFAASALGRSGPLVALLLFTIAFNQMFFLGLYNFALSLSPCLVAFGCAVRGERSGGWWWAGFSLALLLALLSHAGGFVIAVVLTAAWLLPAFVRDIRSRPSIPLRRWWPAVLATLPAILVLLVYLSDQSDHPLKYGASAFKRLKWIVHFNNLRFNGGWSHWIARGFKLLAVGLLLWVGFVRFRAWRTDPTSRFDTIRLAILIGAAWALVLAFPDTMGGGWGHAGRMYLSVYFALLILFAAHPLPESLWRPFTLFALALFGLMLAGTVQRQRQVRSITLESDALLQQVGAHCLVAPIFPDQSRSALPQELQFEPLFHVSTRIEHLKDRVSLLNFLAPLAVYPVSYRPGMSPLKSLYPSMAHELDTGMINIPAFERVSGLRVDYVVTLGPAAALRPGLWPDQRNYRLVASSSRGTFHLYAPKAPPGPEVRTDCRAGS